jgi:hypothetical protein
MTLGKVFDRFARYSPVTVMMRGIMEYVVPPERLDENLPRSRRAAIEGRIAGECGGECVGAGGHWHSRGVSMTPSEAERENLEVSSRSSRFTTS